MVSDENIDSSSLFEVLVAVVLSQNTSDKNAVKALIRLREALGGKITPSALLSASLEVVEDSLKPAGMHRRRARVLKELAEYFSKPGFSEELTSRITREGSVEKARELLVKLPGVGYKTADVVLLRFFGKPVFPVDTHIARITNRLGFTSSRRYLDISRFWMENTSPSNYLDLHLYLITHGRRVCRARNPLCSKCVLRDICSYTGRTRSA
ncbi:MAG: endonuclease III [Desulfurococcus sp.]|nr:endonuclease III [Desulfurococcus sp.]